jgi:hypothetical protein
MNNPKASEPPPLIHTISVGATRAGMSSKKLKLDRKFRRIPGGTGREAEVTITDGETLWSGILLDVSVGGIAVICDREQGMPSGQGVYQVRFPLVPLCVKAEPQLVDARMMLVYCVAQGKSGKYRIGFELLGAKT